MSRKRQLFKVIQKTFTKISKQFLSAINKQIIWLIRAFFGTLRRRNSENAGFLLPTVAMVTLVVVLLTTAILFRSFERSKNASNVRVNEAVINAAAPAIDRARAKLDKLFNDRRLPRSTPSDTALESAFKSYLNEYTFGDETQLNLNYTSQTALPTAWMFPIDTNNNGKFDTYTLYGIYFRNPPITNGTYNRTRNPLEARTPPMASGNLSNGCQDTLGTSATLVGSTGWFNIAGKLKKSFFVYTANVPITNLPTTDSDKYEAFKGNKSFSGLEYQQDRIQLPLVNNAVVYDDDIELTPGPTFNLNGRILTNSNFLTGSDEKLVTLYQVSSKDSCFYDDDNAKIIVGGNLAAGAFTGGSDLDNSTLVHLFQGKGVDPSKTSGVKSNKSVTGKPQDIAYNSLAYVQRINLLVEAQRLNEPSTDPQEVKDGITQQLKVLNLTTSTASAAQQASIRNNQLGLYFKKRTRRVPYAEIKFGVDGKGTYTTTTVLEGSGDSLRPKDPWVYPFAPSDGKTETDYAKLTLNTNSSKLLPSATEPNTQQKLGKEQKVGDRVLIGNNLPALWWNGTRFVGSDSTDTQDIKDTVWDIWDAKYGGIERRNRRSRVQQLADLGTVDRDGDWESAAATVPTTPQDPVGGLRVVTGAGIYLPKGFTVSSTKTDLDTALGITNKIWSDMMPVPTTPSLTAHGQPIIDTRDSKVIFVSPNSDNTPYLRMRATAVYHYQAGSYDPKSPKPIACVSSYYDPTNQDRAKNLNVLPSATDFIYNKDPNGKSHNGIVYKAPTKSATDYTDLLNYQAKLRYRNGRFVNELLSNALAKTDASTRTISEQSAIDAAICAIQILDGTIGTPDDSVIPYGAIYETAFLDARQVKAIHKDLTTEGVETFTNSDGVNGDGTGIVAAVPDPSTTADPAYDLAKERRQPLEIRATVLDISKLRTKFGSATPQEYLIPNSGIIYATRDDALPDLSANGIRAIDITDIQKQAKKDTQKSQSPVDFKLDPTRRPNAIMLINGSKIWRDDNYRDAEKGLILATNLPTYIKGDFNKHTQQEFTTDLASNWSNFYDRTALTRNKQFACRKNDARLKDKCLPDADEWRPASVVSDAITLLSNNFQLGYRNDGDYDLNDNLGDQNSISLFRKNGYRNNNSYVINASWYGSDGYPNVNSSYLNNFVTPIQRRKKAREYLMEVCLKLPASACNPLTDWYVDIIDPLDDTKNKHSWQIATDGSVSKSDLESGTTATPPNNSVNRYPRRLAFKRNSIGLLQSKSSLPIILGIKDGTVKEFPFSDFSTSIPDFADNALWYRTTTDNNDDLRPALFSPIVNTTDQPLLSPVFQLQLAFGNDITKYPLLGPGTGNNQDSYWIQWATETVFNLVAAGGDTPARPTEDNGGLHNFVRFLENWNPTGEITDAIAAKINGSFIQRTRSAYATAPFAAFLNNSAGDSTGTYPINSADKRTSFYMPPNRQWGYDVGLLSQSPDAFSQKLAIAPDDKPNEYFREVGRDDVWVKTLLCAKKADDSYAIDEDQRPCKS